MGENYFTPKQVARAIGVSESSLKRWCDQGKLGTQRTAGGHRRVSLAEVMQFLRETGQGLVCPEVLGLPSACGQGKHVLDKARERFLEAILAGDDERCRRIVIDLFLAKRCISEICDELLAPAMRRCGRSWECGHAEIYQERRACRIVEQILYELRACLTVRTDTGFRAIGGTPSGDPYRLPTMMVELTLRELGRHAENLGSDIPFASLRVAAEQLRPKLFWLSVSTIASVPEFLEGYRDFYRTARRQGTAVVVGGVGLTEPIRRQMEYSAYCDSLRHLREFVATLFPLPPAPCPPPLDELPPCLPCADPAREGFPATALDADLDGNSSLDLPPDAG